MVKLILRLIDVTSEYSGHVFAFLILPTALVIGVDVVLRYGFRSPTIWAHEVSQMLFATYIVIGGAYTLLYDGHVRMDVLLRRLSVRNQALLDLVTYAIFFFPFLGILLWQGTEHAWLATIRGYTTGSTWSPPIWPVRWVFTVAVLLLMLQGVAVFIRKLILVVTRRQQL